MYQKWVRAFAGSIDSEIMGMHSKNRRALRIASVPEAELQAAHIQKLGRTRSVPPASQHLFQSPGGLQSRCPRCNRGSIFQICQEVQTTLQFGHIHYIAKMNLPHNPLVSSLKFLSRCVVISAAGRRLLQRKRHSEAQYRKRGIKKS